MSDLDRLLNRAREWRGLPMAIATVAQTWGSAPRPRGSHILVTSDGRFEGSVSGGCVEGDVLANAAEVITEGGFRQLRYGVDQESAWEVGLPCGGDIVVLVQRVAPDGFAPELFDVLAEARAHRRAVEFSTDLTTGYTCVATETISADGFRNAYLPARRMLIVGAVQIAQSLAAIASELDFTITVIDPRGRFLTRERFPRGELDDCWPDEALVAAQLDQRSAVITLSHDPKLDDPALAAALRMPTGYIAALGSRRSHARRLERLAAAGFDDSDLKRIEGPAGLDISASSAAEIALSIAAGAVKALAAPRI